MNQNSNVGPVSPVPVCGIIDPRIKDELECLNSTSNLINQLENQIREKHDLYRTALAESTQQLNHFSKTLGDCVTKARPYHEAKRKAKEALYDTQCAAANFERAVSMHTAAREMVNVAEQGMLMDSNHLESAWPEMLNQATLKVNEAEVSKNNSEIEHLKCAEIFKNCEKEVTKLERKYKSSINKSRPYFNVKEQSQKRLQDLSESVRKLDVELSKTKLEYAQALRSLEDISNSIHEARKIKELGVRGAGVGAENEAKQTELSHEEQNKEDPKPMTVQQNKNQDNNKTEEEIAVKQTELSHEQQNKEDSKPMTVQQNENQDKHKIEKENDVNQTELTHKGQNIEDPKTLTRQQNENKEENSKPLVITH